MERAKAFELVKEKVSNKNLTKHMLACEAVMCALAKKYGENEDQWGLAGLLHDLDYDLTVNDFKNHGLVTAKWLEDKVNKDVIDAITAHPGHFPRNSKMAKALYAVDPLTGLIVACALIHSAKKLSAIDADFVLKRFDEKRFAAGANREQIKSCSELDMPLEEFIAIGVKAMQEIAEDLGL